MSTNLSEDIALSKMLVGFTGAARVSSPAFDELLRRLRLASSSPRVFEEHTLVVTAWNGGFFSHVNRVVNHLHHSLGREGCVAVRVDWHVGEDTHPVRLRHRAGRRAVAALLRTIHVSRRSTHGADHLEVRRPVDDRAARVPHVQARLGRAGIETAADYAWERRVDALEEFFQRVAGSRGMARAGEVLPETLAWKSR